MKHIDREHEYEATPNRILLDCGPGAHSHVCNLFAIKVS